MHAHTVDNLELNLKVPSPRQTLFITQYTTYLLISKNWGSGTEYKKVCVYETSQRIIGPATNCVLVGKPFFRNLEFLDTAMAYAQAVPLTATILRFVWEPLPDEARQRDRDGHKPMDPEPNDSLQWSIRQAKQMGDPYLWSPTTLTVRVMILDFAALHTTSFAITHALLDLAAPKQKYIDALRDEVQSVLAEHGGEWNKRALAQMVKVDSVLRESQQLNSPVSVGLTRNVTAKEEIITPSGVKIPYGATVCVPGFTVMHDDETLRYRKVGGLRVLVNIPSSICYVQASLCELGTSTRFFVPVAI
ncbi:cytochrome P450 [Neurospora tetraspora]|uniref:Cytochrome P450 n=1 Tax=Neurospora tetraspora TaxID=94610 RepID=A0AAE0MV31_9PEZI|nr:cytochrome P450 [Neurospora tetraspora]